MIEGEKIILRTFKEEDLDEYFRLSNNILQRGEYYPIRLRSEAEWRKKFAENAFWDEEMGMFLITDKKGKFVGEILYFKSHIYFTGLEVGYNIFQDSDRGKGYISEALKIFTAYLFDAKNIPRLYLAIIPGNIASIKVAEKCGFRLDGVLRKANFHHGEYTDLEMYSLMRGECPSFPEVMESLQEGGE